MASQGKKSGGSAADWLLEPAGHRLDETRNANGAEGLAAEEEGSAEASEPVPFDAAQWLVGPNGARNGRAAEKVGPPEAAPVDAKPEPIDPKPPPETERESDAELVERISQLEAQLRAQSEEAEAALARTLAEREAEFAAALRERDAALDERRSELEEQLSRRYEKRKAGLTEDFDQKQAELEQQLTALEMRLDVREEELREQAGRREAKLENRIRELQEELADAKLGTNEADSSKRPRRRASGNGDLDVNEVSFEQLREIGLSITQSARVIAYRDTRGGFDSLDELDDIPGLPKETRGTLKGLLTH